MIRHQYESEDTSTVPGKISGSHWNETHVVSTGAVAFHIGKLTISDTGVGSEASGKSVTSGTGLYTYTISKPVELMASPYGTSSIKATISLASGIPDGWCVEVGISELGGGDFDVVVTVKNALDEFVNPTTKVVAYVSVYMVVEARSTKIG